MKVTDTERFLHYRVEALENALSESQAKLINLKAENKQLKHDLIKHIIEE